MENKEVLNITVIEKNENDLVTEIRFNELALAKNYIAVMSNFDNIKNSIKGEVERVIIKAFKERLTQEPENKNNLIKNFSKGIIGVDLDIDFNKIANDFKPSEVKGTDVN